MEVNLRAIVEEVSGEFEAYERALVANDLQALARLFWPNEDDVRYGIHENLYGATAIAKYRRTTPPGHWSRLLLNTIIVTFGEHAASVSTEFAQADGRVGRQSQMWVRMAEGWRIVAAHVSLMADT